MKRLIPVVVLALLAGCGEGDSSTSTPGSGPLVTYSRTGGFASMPSTLVVEADGSASVEAGTDPARESFTLDEAELGRLQDELDAGLAAYEEPDVPSGCSDCYVYEVDYGGEKISFDESQEVPPAVSAVVTHLNQITVEHFPPGATRPPIVN